MTEILESTVPVIVRFADPDSAETARSTIEDMLKSARREVDTLFAKGGGVADSLQVEKIYAKYGFRNDVGWIQQRPIVTYGCELKWEIPLGVELEDVQLLLLSLGAETITLQLDEDGEMYFKNLHPLSIPVELEEDEMEMDTDLKGFDAPKEYRKKLLH